MAKGRITQKQAEEIQKNNIELAKELTKRKQKVTDLTAQLHDTNYSLLSTERRLAAANTKYFALQNELQTLKQHNQKLQAALNDRDEELADCKRLMVSTFAAATEKYGSIVRAIRAVPTATMVNKKCSNDPASSQDKRVDKNQDDNRDETVIPSAPGASSTPSTKVIANAMPHESDDDNSKVNVDDDDDAERTLRNESTDNASDTTECDGDTFDVTVDVHVSASALSTPLNADTTLVGSVRGEFSDDAVAELSAVVDQLHESLMNSLEHKDFNETICKEESATIPSITVTECSDANDMKTPVKVTKRTKSNGLLQVPKQSFGHRESEPRTSLNSKSSPTFKEHRSKSKRKAANLGKIHELSPLAKSPEHPISSAIRDKKVHQTFHHSSRSNIINNQSSDTNTSFTVKTEPKDRQIPKRILMDMNNNSKQSKNTVASIKTEASIKVKTEVAGPDDCIARRRIPRRAAPRDLRDPMELMKKRRKFD